MEITVEITNFKSQIPMGDSKVNWNLFWNLEIGFWNFKKLFNQLWIY